MHKGSMFVKLTILIIHISIPVITSIKPHDGLFEKILTLGDEDIDYKDYGEFGYNFAPTDALLERAGFLNKLHYFSTEDGYLIELLHIINPLADRTKLRKYPVLLSHGFIQASYNFVCQSINETQALKWPRSSSEKWNRSSDRNLAILLANNGYDVWMSTSRGSLSCTKPKLKLHTKYSTNDPRFWRFSLDEQAQYDIPCQVDGVRKLTGKNKVVFAGYSQSVFTMIGKLATDPGFAKKIHTFLAVGPITTMKHDTGLLRPIGAIVRNLPDFLTDFPFVPVKVGRILTKILLTLYFARPDIVRLLEAIVLNLFFGNNGNKAYDGLVLLFRLLRFPTSFKGFLHFMQIQFEESMSHFDYGPTGNLKRYGSHKPAIYNTSNIELDGIAVYVGDADALSVPEDNKLWIESLRIPLVEHRVIPGWNHLDYIIAEDNDVQMNRPILHLLNKRMMSPQKSPPIELSEELSSISTIIDSI